MLRDLIEFYEEEQWKIERELEELNEVNKRSPKKEKRIMEICYILEGIQAERTIARLSRENWELKNRLKREGIDIGE